MPLLAAKGNFIANQGLAGFAMWEAAGDYDDVLLDAISNAVGNAKGCPSVLSVIL